jgi:hypothetical protein
MPRTIRGVAVVLILALMAGSTAHALPGRPAPSVPEAAGLFAPLWSWLSGLVFPEPPARGSELRSAWADEGSQMDPDGLTTPPPGDAGGEMDPDGLATPPPGDAGSDMDPDG